MKPFLGPGARRRSAFFLFEAVAFLLLAVSSRGAAAQPLGIFLEGTIMHGRPTGNFQLTGLASPSAGNSTTSIDLEADLALGTRTMIPFGARFLTKRFRIEAEYLQSTLSGDAILPGDILFQGVSFHAGDHVGTTLKLRDISASVRFDLFSGPYSDIGVGADLDAFRYSIALEDPVLGLTPTDVKNIYAPVPHVGLSLHDATRAFWLDAKFGYIKISGSKAQKWRIESGYKITQGFGVTAGWRSFSGLWLKDRSPAPDDHIQMKLQQYYAGLFVSF